MQDALSHTDFELMELLDVGKEEVTSAMAHVSEVVCPPCQTVHSSLFLFIINLPNLFRNYWFLWKYCNRRYFCWSSEYATRVWLVIFPLVWKVWMKPCAVVYRLVFWRSWLVQQELAKHRYIGFVTFNTVKFIPGYFSGLDYCEVLNVFSVKVNLDGWILCCSFVWSSHCWLHCQQIVEA